MTSVKGIGSLVFVAVLTIAGPAAAQAISASHLAAASDVVGALRVLDQFDFIPREIALSLEQQLIQHAPDRLQEISDTVGELAPSMDGAHGQLEQEAALAYARIFSEAELNEIYAFYTSAAGLALLSSAGIADSMVKKSADIWRNALEQQFAAAVIAKLNGP